MEFFEVIQKRRSIRRFTDEKVDPQAIEKALQAALLAPTSSNAQTWDFYWATVPETKKKLAYYCLSQSAARTASDLVVVTASPSAWKRSHHALVQYALDIKAPPAVITYYKKLFPFMYRWGFMNSLGLLKKIIYFVTGLIRPVPRGPSTLRDVQEICIKSSALAAENFVLAMTAQGYQTCMMEGFDEKRVKKLLNLKRNDRVVMVIAVGREAERGTWGPQFRMGSENFIHKI